MRVKGHAATGYHIERAPDILAAQLLSHRLYGTPFARRIYHFFKVDSTNNVAMQLGEQAEPHGAVVLAEEQTAGRGRAGRKWISEKSAGISCSVLLRPAIPPAHAPLLTRWLLGSVTRLRKNLIPRRTYVGRTICWCEGENFAEF